MKISDITLREFITKYVDYNTCCRLWIPYAGEERGFEKQLVFGEYNESSGERSECCMEWEILKGTVPQSKYLDCTFAGISDIYMIDSSNVEAINLTVLTDNIKEELYTPYEDNQRTAISNDTKQKSCW